MSDPDAPDAEPGDGPVRPNLVAVVSVALGGCGVASCPWLSPLMVLCGGLGLILALAARRQAAETGYGAEYAWWGTALGTVNLVLGIAIGAWFGLSVLR